MSVPPKQNCREPISDFELPKVRTGISGLDEVTEGGIPLGRTTLVCGGAGAGKTLLGMQFLVCGVLHYKENGVFFSFEETPEELAKNVRSLKYDIFKLAEEKKLFLDFVEVDRTHIVETGEYDLEGLFIRLKDAIDTVGAKRVVLDTLESIFSDFRDPGVIRAELRRLFRWLKDRGVTAIITGEQGEGTLTRHGLEEYVSDCVIFLDHRVIDQVSTRRLRVIKYRGSTHGTNEYPFLMDRSGITVLPITSLDLDYDVADERVSSGVPKLDDMLGKHGFYRGSTVLVSGTAGTGKSSLSAHFVAGGCARGERCIYFALEEAQGQIVRNMRSIGIDLAPRIEKGLLRIIAKRPTSLGLESHLVYMQKEIADFKPTLVIIDPITNMITVGQQLDVRLMMTRLIDFLKAHQITAMMTSLTSGGGPVEDSEVGISSLIDTWILLRELENNGERNRGLYILKSRGMKHSNQIREFLLTENGIDLVDVYLGPEGILTGSARVSQEAKEAAALQARQDEIESKRLHVERKRKALEAQIAAIQAEIQADDDLLELTIKHSDVREIQLQEDRKDMAKSRHVPIDNGALNSKSRLDEK